MPKLTIISLLILLIPFSSHAALFEMELGIQPLPGITEPLAPFAIRVETDPGNWSVTRTWINTDGAWIQDEDGKTQLSRASWSYRDDLFAWELLAFDPVWTFSVGETEYQMLWFWLEIFGTPDSNPLEDFRVAEASWYFGAFGPEFESCNTYQGGYPGCYGGAPASVRKISQVPEPATLSLLFLGLAAIGIRRRLR